MWNYSWFKVCRTDLRVLEVVADGCGCLLAVSPPCSALSQSAAATHASAQLLHFLVLRDGASVQQIQPRSKSAAWLWSRRGWRGRGGQAGWHQAVMEDIFRYFTYNSMVLHWNERRLLKIYQKNICIGLNSLSLKVTVTHYANGLNKILFCFYHWQITAYMGKYFNFKYNLQGLHCRLTASPTDKHILYWAELNILKK